VGNTNSFTTVFRPLDDETENLRNTGNLLTNTIDVNGMKLHGLIIPSKPVLAKP